MFASIVRLSAAAICFSFVACAPARAPGELGFAISNGAQAGARVGEPRVVSSKVNMREPLVLTGLEGEVTMTFGVHGRRGVTLTLAPDSYQARLITPFVYGESATGKPPLHGLAEVTRVALRHGTFACWTEDGTHRALARISGTDGSQVGPELVISGPALDVVGPPQAATADGEHVLVAFFAATDGPFQLVATWLDVP